jgi:hypothetical protein
MIIGAEARSNILCKSGGRTGAAHRYRRLVTVAGCPLSPFANGGFRRYHRLLTVPMGW